MQTILVNIKKNCRLYFWNEEKKLYEPSKYVFLPGDKAKITTENVFIFQPL